MTDDVSANNCYCFRRDKNTGIARRRSHVPPSVSMTMSVCAIATVATLFDATGFFLSMLLRRVIRRTMIFFFYYLVRVCFYWLRSVRRPVYCESCETTGWRAAAVVTRCVARVTVGMVWGREDRARGRRAALAVFSNDLETDNNAADVRTN